MNETTFRKGIRLFLTCLEDSLESLAQVNTNPTTSELPLTSYNVAVKMNTSLQTAQISSIVQELNNACTIISDADLQYEAARLRAISAAKDLVAKLENPPEIILQHAFSVRTVDHCLVSRLGKHFLSFLTYWA